MSVKDRPRWLRYGAAVCALIGAMVMGGIVGNGPFQGASVFFAVLVSAWYGGLGPGIFSIGLPTLVLLNMSDQLAARGGHIDTLALAKELGRPARALGEHHEQPLFAEQALGVLGQAGELARARRPEVHEGDAVHELLGHALREARDVHVSLSGGIVTLRGQVHSVAERDAAVGSAMAAPGVTRVINELTIQA